MTFSVPPLTIWIKRSDVPTQTFSYPSGNASTDMDKVLFSMWGHVSDNFSVELPDVSKTIESREFLRVYPCGSKSRESYLIRLDNSSKTFIFC